MTGSGQLRRLGVALGAVVLLVGLAARGGGGLGRETEKFGGQADATFTANGFLGSPAGGTSHSRVQRDLEVEKGQHGSRLDGVHGPAGLAHVSSAYVTALAAIVERAGHPERLGHILVRGPPPTSA